MSTAVYIHTFDISWINISCMRHYLLFPVFAISWPGVSWRDITRCSLYSTFHDPAFRDATLLVVPCICHFMTRRFVTRHYSLFPVFNISWPGVSWRDITRCSLHSTFRDSRFPAFVISWLADLSPDQVRQDIFTESADALVNVYYTLYTLYIVWCAVLCKCNMTMLETSRTTKQQLIWLCEGLGGRRGRKTQKRHQGSTSQRNEAKKRKKLR